MNQGTLKQIADVRIADLYQKLPALIEILILLALCHFSINEISQIISAARTGFQLDLHVFKDAGQAYKDGAPLYGEGFPDRWGFPFIYPPVAAVFFVPLTWGDQFTIQKWWTILNLVAIWAILSMAFARIIPSIRQRARREKSQHNATASNYAASNAADGSILSKLGTAPMAMIFGFAAIGIALVTDPMQRLFAYGQIDILLALLIVADVLGFTPKWSRGILIGFATGVKITPAAYALVFLARRDFRSIARSIGGLLLFAAVGFLIRPSDSFEFWTKEVFDSNRAGQPSYEGNQAISGLLSRAGIDGSLLSILTIAFFLFGATLAYVLARKILRNGALPRLQNLQIMFVIALCLGMFGPYTVSNHWSVIIVGIPLFFWATAEYAIAGIILYLGHYFEFARNYKIFPGDGHTIADFHTRIIGNTQGELTLIAIMLITYFVFRGPARTQPSPPRVAVDVS